MSGPRQCTVSQQGEDSDEASLLFKKKLIELINNRSFSGRVKAYPRAARSMDILVIGDDTKWLIAGVFLLFFR